MRNYEIKLVDSSRKIADILTNDIGNDPERLSEMIAISLKDQYPLSMRATRVVTLTAEKYPEIIVPFIPEIINKLRSLKVEGVRRGFMKIVADINYEFDEDQTGYIADMAFTCLADTREAIAIRYYSIEILLKIIKVYPELAIELKEILTGMLEEQSAGLISKSKQTLHYLNKLLA